MNGLGHLQGAQPEDDELILVCRDLPDSACREQPRNIARHVASLSLTKVGEGLADAKLVLAWLVDAIGAPTWAIGLLVPVRESLAMLPQLLISARIRQLPIRKHVYVAGCVVQGAAIIGIGVAALTLTGNIAGVVAIALITAFALGRSLCSISHKDVLAKTVDKGRRASVSGVAGSVAAAATLLMAVAYSAGWLPLTVPVVASAVIVGGTAWLLAALVFESIREAPGATEGGVDGLAAVIAQFGLLRSDPRLRQLIITRGLLLSTALAPPFYIALSGDFEPGGLGTLGLFMMALGGGGSGQRLCLGATRGPLEPARADGLRSAGSPGEWGCRRHGAAAAAGAGVRAVPAGPALRADDGAPGGSTRALGPRRRHGRSRQACRLYRAEQFGGWCDAARRGCVWRHRPAFRPGHGAGPVRADGGAGHRGGVGSGRGPGRAGRHGVNGGS
jgi:hypothetical protein